MQLNTVITDEKGNVGPNLPVVQGETKTITIQWFKPNGAQHVFPTISALVAKIQTSPAAASIQKSVVATTVTLLQCTQLGGYIGCQLTLTATDTPQMAANNSGLAMSLAITDSSSNVTDVDVPNAFSVSQPLVS